MGGRGCGYWGDKIPGKCESAPVRGKWWMRECVLIEEGEDKHLLTTGEKAYEFRFLAGCSHETVPTQIVLSLINRKIQEKIAPRGPEKSNDWLIEYS